MQNNYISFFDRGVIIGLKLSGLSDTRVEEIIKQHDIQGSRFSIARLWSNWNEDPQSVQEITEKEGRPQQLNQEDITNLKNYIIEHPNSSRKDLTHNTEANPKGLSGKSLQNYLNEEGFLQKIQKKEMIKLQNQEENNEVVSYNNGANYNLQKIQNNFFICNAFEVNQNLKSVCAYLQQMHQSCQSIFDGIHGELARLNSTNQIDKLKEDLITNKQQHLNREQDNRLEINENNIRSSNSQTQELIRSLEQKIQNISEKLQETQNQAEFNYDDLKLTKERITEYDRKFEYIFDDAKITKAKTNEFERKFEFIFDELKIPNKYNKNEKQKQQEISISVEKTTVDTNNKQNLINQNQNQIQAQTSSKSQINQKEQNLKNLPVKINQIFNQRRKNNNSKQIQNQTAKNQKINQTSVQQNTQPQQSQSEILQFLNQFKQELNQQLAINEIKGCIRDIRDPFNANNQQTHTPQSNQQQHLIMPTPQPIYQQQQQSPQQIRKCQNQYQSTNQQRYKPQYEYNNNKFTNQSRFNKTNNTQNHQQFQSTQQYNKKHIRLPNNFHIIRTEHYGNCFYEAIAISIFAGEKAKEQLEMNWRNTYQKTKIDTSTSQQTKTSNSVQGKYRKKVNMPTPLLSKSQQICTNTFRPSQIQNYKLPKKDQCVILLFSGKQEAGHFDAIISSTTLDRLNQQQKKQKNEKSVNFKTISTIQQQNSNPSPTNSNIISNSMMENISQSPNPNATSSSISIQNNESTEISKDAKTTFASPPLFFCGCQKGKEKTSPYKNWESLRAHYYKFHKETPLPEGSSHDKNGICLNSESFFLKYQKK
ncbi:hypothetical protein ABPG72_021750 [Tetrahymena utriculariae]